MFPSPKFGPKRFVRGDRCWPSWIFAIGGWAGRLNLAMVTHLLYLSTPLKYHMKTDSTPWDSHPTVSKGSTQNTIIASYYDYIIHLTLTVLV